MSQENLDLVRRAYEAWNRGDHETAFELVDPDVEVSPPPIFPEARTLRGRDAIRDWLGEEVLPIFEGLRAEPEEFIDAGDQVVVLVRYYGRGKETGIEVRGAVVDAHVLSLSEGKIRKLKMFQGTEKALQAVGLSRPD